MELKKTSTKRSCCLPLICLICGDTARGLNFDVITCIPCKAFFRRNAFLLKTHRCQRENRCVITKESRSNCAACRLRKCYAFGMNPDLIRSVAKCANNSNMIKQKHIQLPTPVPMGLLRNDRSTLTSNEWNLLSNMIHAYDEHNHIIRFKHLLDEKSSLPPKLRTKMAGISDLGYQYSIGIQPAIERSQHWQLLSNQTRQSLILRNASITGITNAVFICREVDAYRNTAFLIGSSLLYTADRIKNGVRRNKRLEQNGNLIKLMLFALTFSTNCSLVVFNNQEDMKTMSSSTELIHIQDIYVNILWKYLVYLYGYNQAAVRFSSLVKSLLDLISTSSELVENQSHTTMVDRIITKTLHSLTITD